MCDHDHSPQPATPRHGSCLEHGEAHAADHARWSRRDFLSGMGLAAAGGAIMLGGHPLRAFGQTPLLEHLRTLENERILVLVQLSGGNDGLNTIIPKENALYYNARPGLAIPKAQTLALSDELGFNPSFNVRPLYEEGEMAILQNVGYPTPSLSHFTSTDIWLSAATEYESETTGWLGRYLSAEFPNFEEEPPDYPLAVQMGGISSMLFQGEGANLGMSLASPDLFARIAEEGIIYNVDDLPDTTYGAEMAFVRSIANDSFQYASAVQEAAQIGENKVDYPGNNPLSPNLEIVAQLIKGRLGARIYHVSLGGFDTHANQGGRHDTLLRNLAEAITAFLDDLKAENAGLEDDVLVMTFSEFGRRVDMNNSNGTDHGTAAPLFLFGTGVEGGLYGETPNLSDLDQTGNLKFDIDFRAVYATVLQDWFGLEPTVVSDVLGGSFDVLGFVSDPSTPTATEDEPIPQSFTLHQNYPNPFNPQTTITYTLSRTERVTLRIFDVRGRLIQTLVDGTQPAGPHALSFDAGHLPSGTYYYRLETSDGMRTRPMTLLR